MKEKKKKAYTKMFIAGKLAELQRRTGYTTAATIRRIAQSGGAGLDETRQQVYAYMWVHRMELFLPEYLKKFVAAHKKMVQESEEEG